MVVVVVVVLMHFLSPGPFTSPRSHEGAVSHPQGELLCVAFSAKHSSRLPYPLRPDIPRTECPQSFDFVRVSGPGAKGVIPDWCFLCG